MTIRLTIAVCAAFTLAGCTMEGAPQSGTAPAPAVQNDILPAQQASSGQVSDSTTRTTTTVQGNTTRTETTSSSVSVDAGGFLAALSGSPQATSNTAADYTGSWRVSSPNNRECRMTLRAPATSAAPATVQNQGCFQELFGVSRWSLRGSELVLTDSFGKQLASLRPTGRNRLEGGGIILWR